MVSNMTKKKNAAISISKNIEGNGVDVVGLETPKVETFPQIIKEETLEAKQNFTDPNQFTPKSNEYTEAIAELPEARLDITQRWYGEEFLPTYLKARAKLRRIAGLP